jgi:hypothetical protein
MMAFHLEKPYINNIGHTKKKPSAKLVRAQQAHEQYLKNMGLHKDQLAAKPKAAPRTLNKVMVVDRTGPQVTNGFAPGGAKKSVFDSEWKRTYDDDPAMAERERAALAKAEAIKANLYPLYNKGPIQLNTGLKMTELGKRRP